MEMLPYGKYTKEFRQEAVKLVIDDGLSMGCQCMMQPRG
jgi:hypothetical protein